MQSRRTDLAIELSESMERQPKGIRCKEYRLTEELLYSKIYIEDTEAATLLGKSKGKYFSLQWTDMAAKSSEQLHAFAVYGANMLREVADWTDVTRVLAAGLGNRHITPDAYGPKVCDRLFVTRHLQQEVPHLLGNGYRELCALAPGVMGTTGMQTAEILRGVCNAVKPDMVLVIDALASEQTERIGSVLQVSDTGIAPGSGLGHAKEALNAACLGVPVIAIGVPMVTYAAVIANGLICNAFGNTTEEADLAQFTHAVARAEGAELIVTPKHIDILAQKAAKATAMAINMAVHPNFDPKTAAMLAD